MEKYKVLGPDLRNFYRPGTVLQAVFHDIEKDLQAESRVVCQYIVNGLAVAEKDEGRYAGIPLEQVESLEYLSERTDILLKDVFSGWAEAIPELQDGADALATRLKAGQTTGVLKAMHDVVENCHALISSLAAALELTDDSDALTAEFSALEGDTQKVLREAMSCLERQDFVQLALSIEYDLNDHLEKWLGWLRKAGNDAASAMDRTRGSN